jgi:hypothetical protein
MTNSIACFAPIGQATLAATSISAAVALPGTIRGLQDRTMRVFNAGPGGAFLALGNSAVVAVAGGTVTASPDGSLFIPAGVVEMIGLSPGHTHAAAVCAAGETALLRLATGEGV